MDLCQERRFINLNGKIHINEKNNKVVSLIDKNNNVWVVKKKLSEGSFGEIYLYNSCNPEYVDIVIKYFKGDDKEVILDMEQESAIVELFNKYKCRNFVRSGVKELSNQRKIIILERVDADLTGFDFSVYPKPLKIYSQLIEFLYSGSKCAYRKDKLFLDMKPENIGYKLCNDGVKFTFLDLGSFFDINEEEVTATYHINLEKSGDFSNDIMFVYSTVMTLLVIRLQISDRNDSDLFIDYFLDEIASEKKYSGKRGFLPKKNYQRIIKKFKEYLDTKEKFIDYLFETLEGLTQRKPSIGDFLTGLNDNNYY